MIKKKKIIISTKGLTVDLINNYSILHGAKYFPSDFLQNYLLFTSMRDIDCTSNDNDNIES